MSKIYSPKIVTDSLVMCLDASNNKSYPTDLPLKDQLNLWLDAADDTTFSYSSGTTVSQWRDKSGQNNHAVVMGGSPSRSVAINSRKAVSFTSTTSFKCVTGAFISTATHIVVCRATTSSATYQRVYHGGANTDLYVFIGALANNIATFWGNGSSWNDVNANSPSITILNTLRIISAINTGTSATPYYDGTAMTVKSTNPAAYTGYELNTYATGNLQPLVGEVCEIIVFNKQLSLTELKQVHTYLGQKWGISNTDRSIIDLSGNDDNGLLGAGTVAYMPAYDYYNKGSLRFDGSDDYVDLGTNAALTSLTNNITVEAWIKTAFPTNRYTIYGNGYSGTGMMFGTSANTPGGLEVYYPSIYVAYSTAGVLQPDVWQHVVYTRNGSGLNTHAFYINGVSQTVTQTANGGDSWGTSGTNRYLGLRGGVMFNGQMSSTKVYSRALNAAEIAQNYEAQKSRFANTIVQQGLVLNLDAGNPYSYAGAGTTIYDVSATALSWTGSNVTYNSDPVKYFSYNGSNSWLQSSTSAVYDSQTITMECWCYPNTLSQEGFLFEKGQVNTQYSMFFESINATSFVFRTMGTVSNYNLTFNVNTYLIVSAWNHIVCTYNGSSKIAYVNGVQVASVAASGTLPTGQINQYIGRHSSGYFFNGRIAESRVYNIALSAAQVLQNYNATKGRFGL